MTEAVGVPPLTNVQEPTAYQKISVSELNTLLRCSKKHDYAYRQGLTLVEPPTYLSKGSFLHKLMEDYQLHRFNFGPDVPYDLPAAGRKVQAELLQERGATVLEPDRVEVEHVFRDWMQQFHGGEWDALTFNLAGLDLPVVEREFMVDLGWKSLDGEPVLLHGFIDLVTKHRDGSVWLHEHKTASRAWSVNQLQFAYQGVLYLAALEATLEERPDGIQYNFFLPKRFEVQQVYVDQQRVERLLAEVQQAIYLRDTGSIVRQPHWGCNDCWFRPLCYTELVGGDASLIRNSMFKVDEDKAARFNDPE